MLEPVNTNKAPAIQQENDQQYLTREEAKELEQRILNVTRSYIDKGRVRAEKKIQEIKNEIKKMSETQQ